MKQTSGSRLQFPLGFDAVCTCDGVTPVTTLAFRSSLCTVTRAGLTKWLVMKCDLAGPGVQGHWHFPRHIREAVCKPPT